MSNPKDIFDKKESQTDQEVARILKEIKAEKPSAAESKPKKTPDTAAEDPPAMVRLTATGTQTTAPRRQKDGLGKRLFRSLIPQRGDGALEFLRKCLFVLAFLTLVSSAVYLIHDSIWIPTQNTNMNGDLQKVFHAGKGGSETQRRKAMEDLYAKNNDFRAWLTYKAEGDDFLQIDYPVVYIGDNDYYLEHDFNKNYNKNGTLFFDERNTYTLTSTENKVSIIYGHNMLSGQMFAHLNLFLDGVERARSAPVMQLDTMLGSEQYKVFAVMVVNTRKEDGPVFDYLRVNFEDDVDFLNHVNEIRARSLFNYDSVSVEADDELLMLSTCTNTNSVAFENGRLVVVARKVRVGEKETVDTDQITTNNNVVMPYAWYVNRDREPHPYYDGAYIIPTATKAKATTTTAENSGYIRPEIKTDFQTVESTTRPPENVILAGDGQTTSRKVTAPTEKKTAAPKITTKPGTTAPAA